MGGWMDGWTDDDEQSSSHQKHQRFTATAAIIEKTANWRCSCRVIRICKSNLGGFLESDRSDRTLLILIHPCLIELCLIPAYRALYSVQIMYVSLVSKTPKVNSKVARWVRK